MRWHLKSVPLANRLYNNTVPSLHYNDILVGEYFVDLLIKMYCGRVEDCQSAGRTRLECSTII